jgi:hypothetical protein
MRRRASELARRCFAGLRSEIRAAGDRGTAAARRAALAARGLLWPPSRRHWAGLFAAGIVALGIHGWWFHATLAGRLPSILDWRAAAAVLGRDARPGDAVALEPWWAERAREVLPAWLPVMAFPRLAGEDLVGVRRVWLLALPGAPRHRADLGGDLAARAAAVSGPQRLGGLELTRYDVRSPTLPLAFLPDRLASATVSVGDRPCARDARGAFRCPAPPFVVVAREVREVSYLPRPCLYAHPSPGAPLTLSFPGVPLGRALRGHTGIVGEAAWAGKSAVRLSVKIDGHDEGFTEEPPAQPGWHPFEVDTARHAGRSVTVTFVVTAPDVTRRHFCFDAYVLP